MLIFLWFLFGLNRTRWETVHHDSENTALDRAALLGLGFAILPVLLHEILSVPP